MSNAVFNYLNEEELNKVKFIEEFDNVLYKKLEKISNYMLTKKDFKVFLWNSNSPLIIGEDIDELLVSILEKYSGKKSRIMLLTEYETTNIKEDEIIILKDSNEIDNIYKFHEKLMSNNHSLFLHISSKERGKRLSDELNSLKSIVDNFIYIPLNTNSENNISDKNIMKMFFKKLNYAGYNIKIPENDLELKNEFMNSIKTLETATGFNNAFEKTINYIIKNDLANDNEILFNIEMLKRNPAEVMKEVREELNELVGMDYIKEQFEKMFSYLKFKELMAKRGEEDSDFTPNLHMSFLGNPGTGKTTVAKIMAKALSGLGYVSTDKFTIAGEKDLVAGYVGQTSLKTEETIQKAMGGVLFIDEAYSMNNDPMYAPQAIATMLKHMEDPTEDIIFIFAGYSEPMKQFLASNPGLSSRVNLKLEFEDYGNNELIEILNRKAAKKAIDLSEIKDNLVEIFNIQKKKIGKRNFGNARFIDNFFQDMLFQQAYNFKDELLVTTDNEDTERFFKFDLSSIPTKYYDTNFFNRAKDVTKITNKTNLNDIIDGYYESPDELFNDEFNDNKPLNQDDNEFEIEIEEQFSQDIFKLDTEA